MESLVGQTLKHFHVEEMVGKGGMGVVYRGRDTRLHRPVAIKVLRPELTSNQERRQRFLHEARAAAAVTHPSIAQIYDVDEVDGLTYIALEYVEGKTVSQLIAAQELDLIGAVEIALHIAEGLARAHKANIIHRDIKSDNIMLTTDGHAKLLDFGLAKLLDPPEPGEETETYLDLKRTQTLPETQAGLVMGTVTYMSPEQARGRPVNQSSDVFSLGIVLYEMVTGELPFKGDSPLDTMHSIAFEEARPVTVIKKNLPPEIHRIIFRCLRKRPEDRYSDAGELAEDLKRLRRELETGVQRPVSALNVFHRFADWVKFSLPFGTKGFIGIIAVLALAAVLIFTKIEIGGLVAFSVLALLLYRYVRNRKSLMVSRLTGRIARFPEVLAVTVKEDRIIVIADQAKANLYLKVNSLVESVNKKLFFGSPIKAAVWGSLPDEDLKDLLREPGVVYVRDDIVPKSPQSF